MVQILIAVLALGSLLALLGWAGAMERRGRGAAVVAFVVGLNLLEASLYPSQNEVSTGLFHPQIGSLSFRAIDVVIPVVLLAHLLQRRRRESTPATGLLWLAFLAWLATAAVLGAYAGNDLQVVAFEAKALLYLGVLFLVASVPLENYLAGNGLQRFLQAAATLALLLVATDTLGVAVTSDLPIVPLDNAGRLGSDAATLFASLGIVALALGLYTPYRRAACLLPAVPLLAAPLAADQRAAFLGLGFSALVLIAATVRSQRRVHVTPTEVSLVVLAVTACLLAPSLIVRALGQEPPAPVRDNLSATFTSREEQLTTEARLNQLRVSAPLVGERPLLGWGLGKEYIYFEPGYREFQPINLTHNIFSDLLLRTGLVGLLFFLVALGVSLAQGMRSWRLQTAGLTAALSMAATAVVIGLVAKGMVESIFEKYRLAVALGVALGLTLSSARATRSAATSAMLRPPTVSPQSGSERPALESESAIRLKASRG
jgi:O-antigen ligase